MGGVARGEREALGELCARWERRLYGFLLRSGAGEEADDLFQETWIRVARGARGFDPDRRFSTWLFQIALNLCRDRERGRARRSAREPAADGPGVDERADERAGDPSGPGGLRAVDQRLEADRLLALLPEPQREVLLLRYFAGCTEDECARVLGCPRGTVKSRLHAAIHRLAAHVREDEKSRDEESR